MKSKLPAAGLDRTDNMSAVPEATGAFIHCVLGKKDVNCFEKNLPWLRIRGAGKGEEGQF